MSPTAMRGGRCRPARFPLSREWNRGAGMEVLLISPPISFLFPPPSLSIPHFSIPAKAGISSRVSGKFREAEVQCRLRRCVAADAAPRDSRFRGNGRGGREWKRGVNQIGGREWKGGGRGRSDARKKTIKLFSFLECPALISLYNPIQYVSAKGHTSPPLAAER